MLLERESTFAADTPVGAYWLARCHGFAVQGGRTAGVVEDVAFPEVGAPAAFLIVRARTFLGSRSRAISTSEIIDVDPWHNTLRLRSTIRACARHTRRQYAQVRKARFA